MQNRVGVPPQQSQPGSPGIVNRCSNLIGDASPPVRADRPPSPRSESTAMPRPSIAFALGLLVATNARGGEPSVRVSEVTIHGDMDCFKVETPSATYLYGRRGAGFASILDKDGKDWISYRPEGKARGEYRGL